MAPRSRSRRLLAALAAAVALAAATGLPAIAAADDAGPSASDRAALAAAEEQVAAARQRATAAAGRLAAGEARYSALVDRLSAIRADIRNVRREIAFLAPIARSRAIAAYEGGAADPITIWGSAPSLLDGARANELLAASKEPEDEAIFRLEDLGRHLRDQQRAAADEQRNVAGVLSDLRREEAAVNAALVAAQAAEQRARAHIAAAQAAAARRAEAERRAAAARLASAPTTGTGDESSRGALGATTTTTTPTATTAPSAPSSGGGSVLCPVAGPTAFVDTWHAPRPGGRLHEGVDIFSPYRTPNVAVVSGYVTHGQGALEGNGVFLYGDDGNSYWYFHLDSFAGPAGRYERGQTVGYTGDTGNAAEGAYHTHFEYHPGHGAAVNPYPLVKRACG
jgi:murein DD-endopeptidase MepM/ murein hydrolase activator NlpD